MKEINFSNYGYKKDKINGKVFEKKFQIGLENNLDKIDFKFLNAGVIIKIILNEKNDKDKLSGSLKGKVLNSNLKLDFVHDKKEINISNFFFRNRSLSFDNQINLTYDWLVYTSPSPRDPPEYRV